MQSLNSFTKDYTLHHEQIEKLSEIVDLLSEISNQIDVESSSSISYVIQKVQVKYFLAAISEFNNSIFDAVSKNNLSVAESLSRISIEMSVNLIFILGGDRHARSKGLVKSYLESTKKKAKKWEKYAIKVDCVPGKQAAINLHKTMEFHEAYLKNISDLPFESWPNTSADKFCIAGYEDAYRTTFASSSDSVHLLGEDIFNITICTFERQNVQAAMLAGLRAEKESFAIFLLIQSLLFQSEAVIKTFEKLGGCEIETPQVMGLVTKLHKMQEQHESDHKKHSLNL